MGRRGCLGLTILLAVICWLDDARAQETGADLFKQTCRACHTVGGGRLIGPDLKDVHTRRDEAWLREFIRSPQAMIARGDTAALRMQREFQLVMPDPVLSEAQLDEMLAYIRSGMAATAASASTASSLTGEVSVPDPALVAHGRALFLGTEPFTQGGVACQSCHHVQGLSLVGGGLLAKDLSLAYDRLGQPGLEAFLSRPPFPVMEEAFRNKPLTTVEIQALTHFLQDAATSAKADQRRPFAWRFVLGGLVGFLLLLPLYAWFGRKRRPGSVYHEIYRRQLRSE